MVEDVVKGIREGSISKKNAEDILVKEFGLGNNEVSKILMGVSQIKSDDESDKRMLEDLIRKGYSYEDAENIVKAQDVQSSRLVGKAVNSSGEGASFRIEYGDDTFKYDKFNTVDEAVEAAKSVYDSTRFLKVYNGSGTVVFDGAGVNESVRVKNGSRRLKSAGGIDVVVGGVSRSGSSKVESMSKNEDGTFSVTTNDVMNAYRDGIIDEEDARNTLYEECGISEEEIDKLLANG